MINYRRDLPDLMKQMGLPMTAAELGVAEGYNSNDLLTNGIEKLYMVDNWAKIEGITGDGSFDADFHEPNYTKAINRIKHHGEKAIVLRGLTTEMAKEVEDNSLGLVYIDAAHDYNSVKNDISAWFSKLVHGGIMGFHDFQVPQYGVKQAVTEFAKENNLEIFLLPEDKDEDAGCFIIKN